MDVRVLPSRGMEREPVVETGRAKVPNAAGRYAMQGPF